ncbi:hypothetical protein EC973_003364 [Apophysomyces ossiformis]|uniref:MACPF-like domain-containing protein n=1 Tax=Apophysomyces ossiformis TaxID=679940 RepID=A0A8H7BQN2_9FUNG|nr:hypothetical protein EC973_003364 [Apophysomyces ossiformis]
MTGTESSESIPDVLSSGQPEATFDRTTYNKLLTLLDQYKYAPLEETLDEIGAAAHSTNKWIENICLTISGLKPDGYGAQYLQTLDDAFTLMDKLVFSLDQFRDTIGVTDGIPSKILSTLSTVNSNWLYLQEIISYVKGSSKDTHEKGSLSKALDDISHNIVEVWKLVYRFQHRSTASDSSRATNKDGSSIYQGLLVGEKPETTIREIEQAELVEIDTKAEILSNDIKQIQEGVLNKQITEDISEGLSKKIDYVLDQWQDLQTMIDKSKHKLKDASLPVVLQTIFETVESSINELETASDQCYAMVNRVYGLQAPQSTETAEIGPESSSSATVPPLSLEYSEFRILENFKAKDNYTVPTNEKLLDLLAKKITSHPTLDKTILLRHNTILERWTQLRSRMDDIKRKLPDTANILVRHPTKIKTSKNSCFDKVPVPAILEQSGCIQEKEEVKSAADTISGYVQSLHIDGTPAQREAVRINPSASYYLYPEDKYMISDDIILRSYTFAEKRYGKMGFLPRDLPLPGIKEFKADAKRTAEKLGGHSAAKNKMEAIYIPRKCLLFPPNTIQPTKEFVEAVGWALGRSSDVQRFKALQDVFNHYGYYYPYWVVLGGKFTHQTVKDSGDITWSVMMQVIREKIPWEAIGGDTNHLKHPLGVKPWIQSTAACAVPIMVLGMKPTYYLLEKRLAAEVERLYKLQNQYEGSYQISCIHQNHSETTLVRLAQLQPRIGVSKGVHFAGNLADQDAIELTNEADLRKLITVIPDKGRSRITCRVRKTMLGVDASTHAYLDTELSDEAVEDEGFTRAAVMSHIEKNGGELQPATRGTHYFVMYITHAEIRYKRQFVKLSDKLKDAVDKALQMSTDKEKFKALQQVFGTFGYYYPSVIGLGGRAIYKINPNDPSPSWMIENGIATIDRAFKRATHVDDTYVETIDTFPELHKGLHFNGEEAEEQAVEISKKGTFSKLLMLKIYINHPKAEYVKRSPANKEDIKTFSKLDIESYYELPGNYGFTLGAQAVHRERMNGRKHTTLKQKTPYQVAYFVYKELMLQLHFYDELIDATKEFKDAIGNALQEHLSAHDKYYRLQDVFQRFGYYYPSSILYGGRVICQITTPSETQHTVRNSATNPILQKQNDPSTDDEKIKSASTAADKDITKQYPQKNYNESLVKTSAAVLRVHAATEIEKSIAKNDCWEAVGGEANILLFENVRSWLKTIETNQTLIQLKRLKPLYELLDNEMRSKVQQIYENIVMDDCYICYNYSLEMITYLASADQDNNSETMRVPTEDLFEYLLKRSFADMQEAISFCRNACQQAGFSIVVEENTDEIVCIYCSGAITSLNDSTESQHKESDNTCLWGVSIVKTSDGQWRFQKYLCPEESEHNHKLISPETKSKDRHRNKQRTANLGDSEESFIIKIVPTRPMYSAEDPRAHYIKYNDIVRLQYVRRLKEDDENSNVYIRASELKVSGELQLDHISEPNATNNEEKEYEEDFQWRIVPALLEGGDDEEEINYISSAKQDACDKFCLESASKVSSTQTSKNDHRENEYVRKGDVVAFESRRTVNGKTFYWAINFEFDFEGDSTDTWTNTAEFARSNARWRLQPINEYEAERAANHSQQIEVKDRNDIKRLQSSVGVSNNNHDSLFLIGHAYLYGLRGLCIDEAKALKHLKVSASKGNHFAKYELGKLLWNKGEHLEALEMLKQAACLPVVEAHRELADIYHVGYGDAIPRDRSKAFMYYAIGGILGDLKAAMMVGEYYEKGYDSDFGQDVGSALTWYEFVAQCDGGSVGYTAAGRLKHSMATTLTDISEAEDLRQDAYKNFAAAAALEPYSKFMMAMYHLNGFGYQEHNPALGFHLLLTLAESGFTLALTGLAQCYKHGLGVERDHVKELMYRDLAISVKDREIA